MKPRLPALHWPGLHWPSIVGRAWADRGPLLLAAVVVALATLLASAVPTAVHDTSNDALHDAVTRAGTNADIVVRTAFERDGSAYEPRIRQSNLAAVVDDNTSIAQTQLGPALTAASRPPVASVTSPVLKITGNTPGRTLELAYATGGLGTKVQWTAGKPPGSTVSAAQADTAARIGFTPWPVQVGLSQETASKLGVGPGDRIHAQDPLGMDIDVRVSGIFSALDAQDPVWQTGPLLQPVVTPEGVITHIATAGLLTPDSLPDARLAFSDEEMSCTITFQPDPGKMRLDDAAALANAVVALKISSGPSGGLDTSFRWESGLDGVLRGAQGQVAAASAQASVLLLGLIATAGLVLLLAADLLVRRRALVLAGARMRGASLTGIGAELLIESSVVAVVGAGLGLLVGGLLAGGVSWRWPVPVILVAVLAGPALGTRVAARATRGRQVPANRSARRSAERTVALRRVALETVVALSAAAAFVALRQRGVIPAGVGAGSGSVLPAIAPTLGAATGALLLLRLLPPGVNLALARATRSRRSLPLFAAARAAATAARPLPFLVLIMSSALLTFAVSLSATESDGQAQGAWRAVGADARLTMTSSASVQALAQQVAASNGVRQAVAARVIDNVPVRNDVTSGYARLVVVDPAAFKQLLASTPLPDAPQLDQLTPADATGGPVPALLRTSDGELRNGEGLSVLWNGTSVKLHAVGTAPAVGEGEGDILVVDAITFAAAGGPATPDTVWAVGPRAPQAVAAVADPNSVVTLRRDVLTARESAPLAAGLLRLGRASSGVLLLLGLLGVLLGAAASAPARGETLARLRTLGLRPRESRQVAAGELLPPVVVGAVGGLVLGVLLAHASVGLLALRLLTGQATNPALVVPWLTVVPVVLLVLAVAVVVEVESSLHRRERLGQVLRAGTPLS
jgi:putative ABC transport system permease protein